MEEDYDQVTLRHDFTSNKWLLLFGGGTTIDLEQLFSACINGKVGQSEMRSVAWRVALHILPTNLEAWHSALVESRLNYDRLMKKFSWDPCDSKLLDADLSLMNPLSQEPESPWRKKFEDQELQALIDHDVDRTFSEDSFFQSKKNRATIGNILRIYVHATPQLSYVQGMHEVLAPIIYVLNEDARSYAYFQQFNMLTELDRIKADLLAVLNDERYQEHDAYAMFSTIMSRIRVFYTCTTTPLTQKPVKRIDELFHDNHRTILQKASTLFAEDPSTRENEFMGIDSTESESEFFRRLRRIHYKILDRVAPRLQRCLEQRRITLATFAPKGSCLYSKWLRVLFGREFASMNDILLLWDALFASDNGTELELIDYVYVALLIDVHDVFVKCGDDVECMQALRNHSEGMSVTKIVETAIALKWPDRCELPWEYEYQLYGKTDQEMRSRANTSLSTTKNSSNQMKIASLQGIDYLRFNSKNRLKRSATAFGDFILSKFGMGSQDTRVANSIFYDSLAAKTSAAKAAVDAAKRPTTCQLALDEMLSNNDLREKVKEQISLLQMRVYELEEAKCNLLLQLANTSKKMNELFDELQLKLAEAETVSESNAETLIVQQNGQSGENSEYCRQETIDHIRKELIAELNKIADLVAPNEPRVRISLGTSSTNVPRDCVSVSYRRSSVEANGTTSDASLTNNLDSSSRRPLASPCVMPGLRTLNEQIPLTIASRAESKLGSPASPPVQEMQPTAGRFCKMANGNTNSVDPAVEVSAECGPSSSTTAHQPMFDRFAWVMSNLRLPQPRLSSLSYRPLLHEDEEAKRWDERRRKIHDKKKRTEEPSVKKLREMKVFKNHSKSIFGDGEGQNEQIAEEPQDLVSDLIHPVERSRAPILPRGDIERRRNF